MIKATDIIRHIADSEGTTVAELERQLGASNGVFSKAIRNDSDISSKWLIQLLENYPQYQLEDFLFNREKPNVRHVNEASQVYKLKTDKIEPNQMIPVYDVEATAGITPILTHPKDHEPEDYIYIPGLPKCDGFINAAGDSMYPIIKAGDLIAFKQIKDLENIIPGEKYIVGIDLEGDEHILIKYIQKSEYGDEYLAFVSHNHNHQTIDIAKNRIQSVAIIKATLRFETNS